MTVPLDRNPTRLSRSTIALAAGLVMLGSIQTAGVSLAGMPVTAIAGAAILVVGLPHGALDWTVLRERAATSGLRFVYLLLAYVAAGAAMLGLWLLSPVAALVVFLAIAVAHFSQDWQQAGGAIFGIAMAIALLAAPAVTHRREVVTLFCALADDPLGGSVAKLLAVTGMVAAPLATVALARLWRAGSHDRALAGACSLGALLLLPPLAGFALFFCLCHSPIHLRGAMKSGGSRAGLLEVGLPTLAAIGICAALYLGTTNGAPLLRWVSAIFLTLSLLAVAHMVVPLLPTANRHQDEHGVFRHAPRRFGRAITKR